MFTSHFNLFSPLFDSMGSDCLKIIFTQQLHEGKFISCALLRQSVNKTHVLQILISVYDVLL